MAKLKTESVTAVDLQEYLDTTSDFVFEMNILNKLGKAGWECSHGGSYKDPVTGKSRQFDIRANIELGRLNVWMAVECKNVRPYFPLLVSRVPRLADESFHEVLLAFDMNLVPQAPGVLRRYATSLHVSLSESIYDLDDFVGKSVAQVGRDENKRDELTSTDSDMFEKWAQALASSAELVRNSCPDDFQNSYAALTVVLPVVVVPDQTLWAADFDETGKQIDGPKSVDRIDYFVGTSIPAGDNFTRIDYRVSHIIMLTECGLLNMATAIKTGRMIPALFPRESLEQAFVDYQNQEFGQDVGLNLKTSLGIRNL